MTKVLYNGEYIELADELEPGYLELDLLNPDKKSKKDEVDLEDTIEIKINNLEDTGILNIGDKDE